MRIGILGSAAFATIAAAFLALPAQAQTTTTAGATVCADGTSMPGTARDVCAGHGGLKAAARTTTHSRVTCADSTLSSTKDGCKDHGGVKSTTNVTRTTTVSKSKGRADDRDSTGAIAVCKDGMYSHAKTHRAACTEHGGVQRFLRS